MFTYGTQYLRGATPDKDQWKRDLENIKKHGFNTVRAWLVWNAVEKREGEIDEKYITDFLNIAKDNGLEVGLLFHLHACPYWAIQKYSKYFYVDERNLPFEPAVRANTPSGGWPGLCFDNDEVREMEKSFIEKVVKVTDGYKNVAFYEPMNEPHQWIDFVNVPLKIFCYCEQTTKKFRIWLKKKYKDIENLNKAWGYFYSSFDEVRPPRWMTSYADYTDFRLFTMDNIVEEISFRKDVIKGLSDKPVIAHSWGGGSATCAQLGSMAFDDWKNAKVFDKWGYSAFPQTKNDAVTLGLGCDATRSAANGKEFWQSELTAGLNGTGLDRAGRVDDDTFYNFTLESLRHGAKGLLFWAYRKERFGQELGGFALTGNAGEDTNLTRCAEELGKILRENSDVFENSKIESSKIALIFSPKSYIVDWCSTGKWNNKFSVDSTSGYYKMFWEENIQVDIIHEEQNVDLSVYKVIIAPTPFALTEDFAKRIKEYVENGGTFISDAYFGGLDDNCNLSYTVPGYGFDKVFGCVEDDLKNGNETELNKDGATFNVIGSRMRETFNLTDGEGIYFYKDGSPAIIRKNFGKGTAVLSGVNLGFAYSSRTLISDDVKSEDKGNRSEDAKKIIFEIIGDGKLLENGCSAEGVKYSVLSDGNNKDAVIILINSTNEDKGGIVKLKKPYSGVKSYLNGDFSVFSDKLKFTLRKNASAVVRLIK